MEYQVTMPFRGVSADDRRTDRRNRLVEAAFGIAGTEGAGALGVGRVWANPDCGLKTRRYDEIIPTLRHLVTAARQSRPGPEPHSHRNTGPS